HEGMIAYYDFDDASAIEDGTVTDFVAGMEGVVNGTGVTATDGQFGSAIDFGTEASDTSVTIEYVNDWLAPASDADQLSVSVWQKLHEVRSTSTLWFSAASAPGGQRNYQAHIPWGNSNIYFDTAGCCGGGDTRISAAGGIDFLEWHHFVFVKDGENKTIYIDGELFLEGVNTGTLYDDWGTTYLGVNDLGNGGHMAGIIDDFGVWARPLTEAEIQYLAEGNAIGSPGFGPKIVGKFEANWDDEEEPAGTYMSGVAAISTDEDGENPSLHITDAANGANGALTIEDFSRGAVFTDFEMSFRLYMTDSTCCGGGDDTLADHRPADGMSISIGNDLPDTISLAEEGSGSGIRICFDTWDSGGGEAPAIDVWRGAEGEVGDGDQGGWSGGMVVRQNFNGVTTASEEELFRDENGDYVWMWTQGEWADVKIAFMDGSLKINFKGHEVINHELPAAWGPMVGPNWLFAARTGGANETHWIDDLSIVLYGSTAPGVTSFEADAAGWELQITDIEEAGVDLESVVVTYEGEVLDVPATKADGVTTIKYASAEILASNSDHALKVAFKDTNGKNQLLNLDFTVMDYLLVDSTVRLDESSKGESGFLVYPTQISSGQGVGNLHGNNWQNAERQIRGEYIDPDMEEPYLNEADIDAFEGWSYYPEIVEVVNQNQDAPGAVGNFNANNGYEDEPLTGIPGWGDSTDGIASEYIALLELERGAYRLGVNSDDGFNASFGANFGDLLAQTAGMFNGGRGASDTNFDIFIEEPGLYPYRVSWWEGGGGANIEIFSYVDGERTLINDPDVEGSIKAYTLAGAVVDESTTVRATTGRAKVLSVAPSPGDSMVRSSEIAVVIQNEDTTVKQDTVVLSLNGEVLDANVSKSGDIVTISYSP
ncbi:MAG: LamG domain-containing protein, partial [Candidatus Thalassarchaeaceae archaeon]|nr:LamG domain-containing protein [Candidatus Thalassarchaeaceae archaeon]